MAVNHRPISETDRRKAARTWLWTSGLALVLVAAGFALRVALERPTTPVILTIVATAMLATAGGARLINERRRHEEDRKRLDRYRDIQHRATRFLAEVEGLGDVGPRLLRLLGEATRWPCGMLWEAAPDGGLRCAEVWEDSELDGSPRPFEVGDTIELGEDAPEETTWVDPRSADSRVPGADRLARAGSRRVLWVPITIRGHSLGALQMITPEELEHDRELISMTDAVARLLTQLVERRRAEQAAERLKGEFFGMVSHEMRTPLTSIIGYAELLADVEAENLSEQGRSFVEVIERNARREMRLVGDLLILVRIEAGTFTIDLEAASLAELAREAVDAALPRADGAGVTLSMHVAADLPPLAGDPHRLGQVLDNLLSNAIKFTPEGGEVELHLSRENQAAVVEVRDSGIGIPADEQKRLFDRLYRASSATRRHIPGVGLGLTIVKAIVEAHEGKVSVRSEEGVGTTFRVELPVRPPPAESDERRPAPDRLARSEAPA